MSRLDALLDERKELRRDRADDKKRVTALRKQLRLICEAIKEHKDAKEDAGEDVREAHADRLAALHKRKRHIESEIDAEQKSLAGLRRKVKAVTKRITHLRNRISLRKDYASPHFRFDEFNCREGGPVPSYMYPHLRALCKDVLEPMRAEFGPAHVNSGHRWRFYNIKIGGALNSFHEYEMRKSQPASDVTFANGSPSEWAAYARQLGKGGVGQYTTFCHVDTGPRRDWWG